MRLAMLSYLQREIDAHPLKEAAAAIGLRMQGQAIIDLARNSAVEDGSDVVKGAEMIALGHLQAGVFMLCANIAMAKEYIPTGDTATPPEPVFPEEGYLDPELRHLIGWARRYGKEFETAMGRAAYDDAWDVIGEADKKPTAEAIAHLEMHAMTNLYAAAMMLQHVRTLQKRMGAA